MEKRLKKFYYINSVTVSTSLGQIVKPTSKEQEEFKILRKDIKRCENLIKVSEDNTKLTQELTNKQTNLTNSMKKLNL